MQILAYLLSIVYGLLMSTLSIIAFQQQKLSSFLAIFTIFSGLSLVFSPFIDTRLQLLSVIVSLSLLLIAAIMNGIQLNGKVNSQHLAIRCCFSLLIIYLYWLKNK